jgi:hypothetical protein
MLNNLLLSWSELNFDGIWVGTGTLFSIILTRWACIKGEYHFTKKFWIVFLAIGIISIALALYIENVVLSAILSIFGFSNLWGIGEVIEQEQRVAKGWFPKKQRKK